MFVFLAQNARSEDVAIAKCELESVRYSGRCEGAKACVDIGVLSDICRAGGNSLLVRRYQVKPEQMTISVVEKQDVKVLFRGDKTASYQLIFQDESGRDVTALLVSSGRLQSECNGDDSTHCDYVLHVEGIPDLIGGRLLKYTIRAADAAKHGIIELDPTIITKPA